MRIPGIPYHQGRNNYSDRDGRHYGIAIHNTSNTASDEAEASYADHRTDGTSSHFYVDSDTVIQSLDTDAKAGHAGSGYGNENAIAFELTGTNDKPRSWWLANVAWDRLGYVIAHILRHDPDYAGFQVRRASVPEMRTNPRVKAFYGHDDMRQAWGGTTHTDPGPNFPWDRLFEAVNAALHGPTESTTPDTLRELQMQMLVKFSDAADPNQVWLCDGMLRRKVAAADIPAVGNSQTHQPSFFGNLGNGGSVFTSQGNPDVWGVDVATLHASLTDAQVDAVSGKVAAAVVAAPDNDKPAIVAAVKQALREGAAG